MADIEKLDLSMAGERCDDAVMPCPFCGGESLLRDRYINGAANTKHYIRECRHCKATFANWYRSIKKANEAWNRRAQPDNEPLTLEQLREAKDGAPLWMAYEDGAYGEWGLVCYNRDSFTVVGLHEHHKPDDYGKTWLAYRRKPERSEQE